MSVLDIFEHEFEKRKNKVKNSESHYVPGGNVYYISSTDGDDLNDGTSPGSAWKTLRKVSSFSFSYGDCVLFRRGDVFRGSVITKPGVTYSAYGNGEKPKFYGCCKSLCDMSLWTLYDKEKNIYKCTEPMHDAGTLVFNGGKFCSRKLIPSYNGKCFVLRDDTSVEFILSEQMTCDLDMYWEFSGSVFDTGTTRGQDFPVPEMYKENPEGTLYLRCDRGNPGEVFSEIESVARVHMFNVGDNENVTIDNLCIKYVGMHGVTGGGHVKGLCVKNCEFGYIGGAIQHFLGTDPNFEAGGRGSVTRFGNAVEIYGGCEDYTVCNNYIYECYDAAITHQITTDRELVMKNIRYTGNVIEKCVYGIEYFLNKINADNKSKMQTVEICDNFIRLTGFGWGQQRHNFDTPAAIKSWNFANTAENFIIRNNIFDRSAYRLLHLVCDCENSLPRLYQNSYIQSENALFGQYACAENAHEQMLVFDKNVSKTVAEIIGDGMAEIYFV